MMSIEEGQKFVWLSNTDKEMYKNDFYPDSKEKTQLEGVKIMLDHKKSLKYNLTDVNN